jgi:hypothetical protein
MQDREDSPRGRRVGRGKLAFRIHLTVYALVNALLIGINLGTSTKHLWFKWPLIGWGVGILAHAVVAFSLPGRRRV